MSNDNRRGPGRGPMGHGRGMMPGEKAKDFKGTMKKLMSYLGKYTYAIIAVFIFAIGSVAFSVIGPKVLGKATTEIFNGLIGKISGGDGIDFDKIKIILLTLVALYIVSAILSFIQGFIMSGISQKLAYNLRDELSKKINRLPMSYFDKTTNGEVLSRFTNDIDTLAQSLNQSLTQIITAVTTLVGVFIMMLTISGIMTVAALVIIPIGMFAISMIIKRSQKFFAQQQEFLGNVNGQVEELYGGHLVVQAFNGQGDAIEKFDKTNEKLYQSAWKSQFLSGLMQPLMSFIGNLGYVLISILGGFLVIKNYIEVGDIQSFIQYVRQFNQPLNQIAQISNQLQATAASAERIFAFLAEEEEPVTENDSVKVTRHDGEVIFDHVRFGYDENKVIIKDFNAKVKPGQKIAIVGPTGAGKTTIIKLLMRFYDVNSGAIYVDGKNIKDYNRQELRSHFGMVLQDTWLFSGSIKDNIKYGKLDATDEQVKQAAKAAHVDHFIKTLPSGYDIKRRGKQRFTRSETITYNSSCNTCRPRNINIRRSDKFCRYKNRSFNPKSYG